MAGIAGTQQPPAIVGRKGRQATHPKKEREEIEGAPNWYSDISAVQKFMEVIPTPTFLYSKEADIG